MLTVTGYEYRKLVEGGEMMEGAVSSIMGKGKKLTDALNLGSGSSSIMGKGKKLTDALNLGSDAAKSPLRLEISSNPGLPLQIAKFDPTTNPIPIVDALPVAKASLIPQVMGEALQSMKTSATTHPVGNYEKPFGPKIQSSKTGTSGKNVKSGKKSFLRKLKDKPWSPKPRPQAPSMTGSR